MKEWQLTNKMLEKYCKLNCVVVIGMCNAHHNVPLDMKGCICHKWQIHQVADTPFHIQGDDKSLGGQPPKLLCERDLCIYTYIYIYIHISVLALIHISDRF